MYALKDKSTTKIPTTIGGMMSGAMSSGIGNLGSIGPISALAATASSMHYLKNSGKGSMFVGSQAKKTAAGAAGLAGAGITAISKASSVGNNVGSTMVGASKALGKAGLGMVKDKLSHANSNTVGGKLSARIEQMFN